MQKIAFFGKILSGFILFIFSSGVYSQTPQQIEQFKQLPPSQQRLLAQQLGVDVSSLMQQSSGVSTEQQTNNIQNGYPEGTLFDEFGNPKTQESEDNFLETNNEPQLYGRSLFDNAPASFTPVSQVAVPSSYLLAPGDQLVINLFGTENAQHTLTVNAEGNIIVPRFGPINVASKTFIEAKQFVASKIKEQVIGVNVSISMGDLRTIQVFVAGEAKRPGTYNISSLSTITHALFLSGGVTEIASLRNISLKRSGKLISTLDIYDLLLDGDTSDDVLLQSGDVIFVPSLEKSITVTGNVRRPAIYELKDESSFGEALALAGGILPDAYTKAINIERFIDGIRTQLTLPYSAQNELIADGDLIYVAPASDFVDNSVSLIGAVPRPGKYQWREGMKVSDIIKTPQVDALRGADLSYVLIVRDRIENIETFQVNLFRGENFDLENNDMVLVFSEQEDIVLGRDELEDLALTEQALRENEQEEWQTYVEQQLFWQQIGIYDSAQSTDEFEEANIAQRPVIVLDDEVKERMREMMDSVVFSRKRLLQPVLDKLRKRSGFNSSVKIVEIDGEVRVPGKYPLTENATILDIITAAGGLTESAFAERAEVTRLNVLTDGTTDIEHLSFNTQAVLNNSPSANIELKSRDRINIFTTPSWQEELRVTVQGEVKFPGIYTIRRGETLSSLMKRVGGLTDYGAAESAIFTRASLKELEAENLKRLAQDLRKQIASESLRRQTGGGSLVSYDQAKQLLRDLTRVQPVGRLVIDLERVLEGQVESDVVLQDGDALVIPGESQSVNVIGEVFVPTSHLFTDGLNFDDYISRSGGFKELADEEKAYIIRADGSVIVPQANNSFWFSDSSKTNIMPGDTIVVPLDSGHVDNVTLWTNVTQIVYQLAVTIAALGSL